MLQGDFYFEALRERLTEVYDRSIVDQILPFQKEHYYDFGDELDVSTVSDADLKKIGQYVEESNLYDMTDEESERLLTLR